MTTFASHASRLSRAGVSLLAGVSLITACAARSTSTSEGTDTDATAGSSSATDAITGTADSTQGATAASGVSSESLDTSDAGTTSEGGSIDDGSDASTDPGTSDTGGEQSMFGRYQLTGGEVAIEPSGCAVDQGGAPEWSIDLDEPGRDGTFVMHETFGAFANVFACTTSDGDGGFSCAFAVTVDYAGMGGPDAVVHLEAVYDATWQEEEELAGRYDVDFTCEGTECATVTEQWNVVAFPCAIEVAFTGVLDEAGG